MVQISKGQLLDAGKRLFMERPNLRGHTGGLNQRGDDCQYFVWELRDGGVRLIATCSKRSRQEQEEVSEL